MNGHRIDVLAQMLGALREEGERYVEDATTGKTSPPVSERHTHFDAGDTIETAIMELPAQSTRNAMVKLTIAGLWAREMHECNYQEDEADRRNRLTWLALEDVAAFLGGQSGIAIDQLGLGSWYDLGSAGDPETVSITAPPARPDADLEAAWAEWQRLRTVINEGPDDTPEDVWNRQQAQVDFIIHTPAVSLAGVAVRLCLLREEISMGQWVHQEKLIDSILADLDRLAKGGGA